MNFKELVSHIAVSEGVPAAKVRKITTAALKSIYESVERGENFQSPAFRIKVINVPEQKRLDKDTGSEIVVLADTLAFIIGPTPVKDKEKLTGVPVIDQKKPSKKA